MTGKLALGPANDRKEGWLKAPLQGTRAHFYVRDMALGGGSYAWVALCGHEAVTNERVPMLDAGNWPRCMHCLKRAKA
jgi:hypothetical protein